MRGGKCLEARKRLLATAEGIWGSRVHCQGEDALGHQSQRCSRAFGTRDGNTAWEVPIIRKDLCAESLVVGQLESKDTSVPRNDIP